MLVPITNTAACAPTGFTDSTNVFLVHRHKEPAITKIKISHKMNQAGGSRNGFQCSYEVM